MIHDEELIKKIALNVQENYGMGGLAEGLYLDFATDVAIRYANAMEKRKEEVMPEKKQTAVEWFYDKIKPHFEKSEVYYSPSYYKALIEALDFTLVIAKQKEREQLFGKSVCPLCDGKGRRVFPNCTPPIDEVCPACGGD